MECELFIKFMQQHQDLFVQRAWLKDVFSSNTESDSDDIRASLNCIESYLSESDPDADLGDVIDHINECENAICVRYRKNPDHEWTQCVGCKSYLGEFRVKDLSICCECDRTFCARRNSGGGAPVGCCGYCDHCQQDLCDDCEHYGRGAHMVWCVNIDIPRGKDSSICAGVESCKAEEEDDNDSKLKKCKECTSWFCRDKCYESHIQICAKSKRKKRKRVS